MRKSIQRALALAGAAPLVAASLVTGATAAHAVVPACPDSSDVVDFEVVVAGEFRIASYPVTSSERNICIQLLTTAHAVVVLKTRASVTPPTVTPTDGLGSCQTTLFSMDDPTDLTLSIGASTSVPSVCIGKDGVTTTITFGAPAVNALPDVDVYLPANTFLLTYGYCGAQYAQYTANPNAATQAAWVACYSTDRKIG